MQYTMHYDSPLGGLLLAADAQGLIGLWCDGGKYYAHGLAQEHAAGSLPALEETRRWLDIYFNGREPDFTPPLHMLGTDYQKDVWKILLRIPYGQTTTYGAIAAELAQLRGMPRMSAQAVGAAVGHNKISFIIPCHRVVGSNGSLTGYAGGLVKKAALLRMEGVDMAGLFMPDKGTAL